MIETGVRRCEVGIERVERRPVDVQPGRLDALDHRLEVGSELARLVVRRHVTEHDEAGAQGEQPDDRERDAAEHDPPPAPCPSRRCRRRGCVVAVHGAGYATTMNRGDVGWYEVDVCSVSRSVDVGRRYFVASHGTLGRTSSTT